MTIDRTQALQRVNHGALAKMLVELADEGLRVSRLLLISPNADDHRCLRALYPKARIAVTYRNDWDLDQPPPRRFPQFDLVVASNVMMYSPDPARWVANVLSLGNVFAFQDLQYRRRAAKAPYFGDDGDSRRYALAPAAAAPPQALFALQTLDWPLLKYREFVGVSNAYHPAGDEPVHVCAALQRRPGEAGAGPDRPAAPSFFAWQSFPLARARNLVLKRLPGRS